MQRSNWRYPILKVILDINVHNGRTSQRFYQTVKVWKTQKETKTSHNNITTLQYPTIISYMLPLSTCVTCPANEQNYANLKITKTIC